jgi:hypothetical protein
MEVGMNKYSRKSMASDATSAIRVLARWAVLLGAAVISANWLLSAVRRASPPAPDPISSDEEVVETNGDKPQIESVYARLDRQELKRRVGESFPNVQMTAISIVLGVALGILAENTFGAASDLRSTRIEELVAMAPYAILSFTVIVFSVFEYSWFIGIYRWSPKLPDIVNPFLVGIGEIAPLFFLASPTMWWILNGLANLAGTVAYTNTLIHTRPRLFADEAVYRRTKIEFTINVLITLVAALAFPLIGLFYRDSPRVHLWHMLEVIGLIVYFAGLALMAVKEQLLVRYLHHSHGLEY